jgi:Spy/CpxP family protein refolding chaperone
MLGLDRRQKEELWSVAREIREAMGAARFGGLEGLDVLVDAVSSESFDRASVESVAERHGQAVSALREKIVGAAERVHAILTPEQRRRLRDYFLGTPSDTPGGPAGGPYRTAV